MTYEQVAWASLHDWFSGSVWVSGDCYKVIAIDDDGTLKTFTEYENLREWAGY